MKKIFSILSFILVSNFNSDSINYIEKNNFNATKLTLSTIMTTICLKIHNELKEDALRKIEALGERADVLGPRELEAINRIRDGGPMFRYGAACLWHYARLKNNPNIKEKYKSGVFLLTPLVTTGVVTGLLIKSDYCNLI